MDLVLRHSDGAGYAQLIETAGTVTVYGLEVAVASVEAMISSREAAGRAKDHRALPFLYELMRRRGAEPS